MNPHVHISKSRVGLHEAMEVNWFVPHVAAAGREAPAMTVFMVCAHEYVMQAHAG